MTRRGAGGPPLRPVQRRRMIRPPRSIACAVSGTWRAPSVTGLTADFESFKSQVATVGEEAARRHGWCGAYDAILNELGLARPVRRVTGTITLKFGFTGTPPGRCRAGDVAPVRSGQPATGGLEMAEWFDNDWQDVEITIDRDLVVVSEVTMAADS